MLLWLTDTHLDFLKADNASREFGGYLLKENPNASAMIISGDVSNAYMLEPDLIQLAQGFEKDIFFVLGNHDYFGSSFQDIEDKIIRLMKRYPNLKWLNQGWYRHEGCIIAGVGGWYDAYHGNALSSVALLDWYEIKDLLHGLSNRGILLDLIREKAGKEADILAKQLKKACKEPEEIIIVATHIAPYPEASWHNGEMSDRDWLPWFTSASTGAVLDTYARRYPEKKFICLCGHTHGCGIYKREENLIVYTGKAIYGVPDLAGTINLQKKVIRALDQLSNSIEERII